MTKKLLKTGIAAILFATAPSLNAQCEAPLLEVPYAIGFEEEDFNACLTYEDVNGGVDSGWEYSDVFPTDFGDYSMVYTYDSDLPGDDWFFTHGLSLTGGTSYTLTFRHRSGLGSLGYFENLEVKYGNAATAVAMEQVPLVTLENMDTDFDSVFGTATATFTPAADGVYYVGFHSYSEADEGYIQIDDISVTTTLSTGNHTKTAYYAYPNPVESMLYFSNPETVGTIAVYNMLGQQVLSNSTSAPNGLNMSSLSAGPYIVRLSGAETVQTIRITKK